MTVADLLSSLSSEELTEWMYYFTIKASEQELARKASDSGTKDGTMG